MKPLPPLNALRAFDAAVRTGSFTRAGESLHVTQGAVSRRIKQLEDWLGRPVFVRHHQGLVLTPAGSLLAKSLDSAFGTILEAVGQIQHLGARQRIAVNVPETFASRWLAPRLRAFHGRHPEIDLSITTSSVGSLREAQQYDCLVMFLDAPWSVSAAPRRPGQARATAHQGDADLALDCRLLRQEQYIAVASPELWSGGTAPDLAQATLLHVLAGNKRLPMWENWLASLGLRHIDPRPGIAFSTMDQAINAAISGAGVAVVDAPMVERELAEQRLRRLDNHELTSHYGYWFVEPRERGQREASHSAVVDLFQSWLLELSRGTLAATGAPMPAVG